MIMIKSQMLVWHGSKILKISEKHEKGGTSTVNQAENKYNYRYLDKVLASLTTAFKFTKRFHQTQYKKTPTAASNSFCIK